MIAQNLIIIAGNIKFIVVEDCDGDYYLREIEVPDYYLWNIRVIPEIKRNLRLSRQRKNMARFGY